MAVRSKRCSKCRETKPVAEFTKNKARKDGLNHSCRECHRKYVRKHYKENEDYYVAKAGRAKAAIREAVKRAKEKPCADCKHEYPYYVMDFDHVRGEKRFDIGVASFGRMGMKAIMEEISKCDVVCANCHRVRTHDRLEPRR